ncbi:unnamed protein product [Ambrosiozyma monospora]|uniref:Unnamed protein product n=1 Tax=Ambrosiozyma monospora TaxID=43982 RepID=A0A9W6T9J4_AMBMO|nr:unnamed protein product [Ambrosiozyma monospora]
MVRRAHTSQVEHSATGVWEVLHLDSCGPYYNWEGAKLYITLMMDDFSKYLFTLVTEDENEEEKGGKGKIALEVTEVLDRVSRKIGKKVREIYTDAGTEFNKIETSATIHRAPIGDKEYNGSAERAVKTLKTLVETVRAHVNVACRSFFIKEAVNLSTTLYNLTPHRSINKLTPQNVFYNIRSLPKRIPTFLEDCYLLNVKYRYNEKGFFLNYDPTDRLYSFFSMNKWQVIKSREFTTLHSYDFANEYITDVTMGDGAKVIGEVKVIGEIPNTFKQAMEIPEWVTSVKKECDSFVVNKAMSTYEKKNSLDRQIVWLRSFWIFVRKEVTNAPKSRLIIIDPKTIYRKDRKNSSPVARQSTILALIVKHQGTTGNVLLSFDVKNAFLNTPIEDKTKDYVLSTPRGLEEEYGRGS